MRPDYASRNLNRLLEYDIIRCLKKGEFVMGLERVMVKLRRIARRYAYSLSSHVFDVDDFVQDMVLDLLRYNRGVFQFALLFGDHVLLNRLAKQSALRILRREGRYAMRFVSLDSIAFEFPDHSQERQQRVAELRIDFEEHYYNGLSKVLCHPELYWGYCLKSGVNGKEGNQRRHIGRLREPTLYGIGRSVGLSRYNAAKAAKQIKESMQ